MISILAVLITIGAVLALVLSVVLVRLVTDRREKERIQIMLDTTPLVMNFWNREFINTKTNEEAVKLFGVASKQEYLDKYFDLSPEYQPDGKHSRNKTFELIKKAFDEGFCEFEWMHQSLSGELIPTEVTLVRVKYRKDYIVAGYTRDMREMLKLAAEKENAEKSSRHMNTFLANMSHEIRTPMNVILGITEIHMQNGTYSHETQEAFNIIYNSGYLLLKIINTILDMSKIQAGKLELVPINYDVASLINDTVHMFIMHYDTKPINFMIHADENIPSTLFGDDLRIKQVLSNLLSNAFKYTDTGEILFSVSVENADDIEEQVILIFRVQDTGQGMTREQLDNLFEEYTRFNPEVNRNTEGVGLGMAITRHLVEMMNGDISIESEPGKGTVFTVRLPQKKVDDGILGKEISEELKQFQMGKSFDKIKSTQIIREYMPYGRILIVDDVDTNLYVARGLMALYGLSIEAVSSGFEAIEKIKDGCSYDIIFMDHFMPEMDGIETTKNIRALGYNYPIVALTANAMIGQAEVFIENGFNGFISKPIDVRQLNTILNKFVRDMHPPEVVETARRLKARLQTNIKEFEQPQLDQKLIDTFVNEAEKAVSILKKIIDNNCKRADDIKSYIIKVHSMKSGLANVNETEMSEFAYRLEKAGQDYDIDIILGETPAFINELNSIIIKFKPEAIKESEISDDDEVTAENAAFLREKMIEIKKACEKFEINDAKAALETLKQKPWPRRINNILNEISVHLLHSALKITSVIAENTANFYKN
jgi:signal transduction histidine kinase/CheY-like chemotaxis protein/HPt (histidine-containing phosphotransfer) domain-containing protein